MKKYKINGKYVKINVNSANAKYKNDDKKHSKEGFETKRSLNGLIENGNKLIHEIEITKVKTSNLIDTTNEIIFDTKQYDNSNDILEEKIVDDYEEVIVNEVLDACDKQENIEINKCVEKDVEINNNVEENQEAVINEDKCIEELHDKNKEVVIRTEDLCKFYGEGDGTTIALDNVNLEIYKGELIVILGSSGSGKSTLLNLLGGVDYASSGKIIFNGQNICELKDKKLTKYRKDNIGFVFQSFNLIQTLTARENVLMALDKDDDERINEVFELVNLSNKKNSYPSQLSGGQQQRVSIARALIKNAPLLLCDEPTGALDYENGKSIIVKLEELSRVHHKTVVIVTHTKEIGDMADRVVMMRNGKITNIVDNKNPVPAAQIEW